MPDHRKRDKKNFFVIFSTMIGTLRSSGYCLTLRCRNASFSVRVSSCFRVLATAAKFREIVLEHLLRRLSTKNAHLVISETRKARNQLHRRIRKTVTVRSRFSQAPDAPPGFASCVPSESAEVSARFTNPIVARHGWSYVDYFGSGRDHGKRIDEEVDRL